MLDTHDRHSTTKCLGASTRAAHPRPPAPLDASHSPSRLNRRAHVQSHKVKGVPMTSPSKLGILAAALLAASAWAQTGTTAPGNATTAASPAPATSAVVNPNRFDPANSHLRRDCFDDTTKT